MGVDEHAQQEHHPGHLVVRAETLEVEAVHRVDVADVHFATALWQEHLLDQPLPRVARAPPLLDVLGRFFYRVIVN